VTSVDDRPDDVDKLPSSETRPVGRFNAVGVPTERSKDFGSVVGRLARLLSTEKPRLVMVGVFSVTSVVLNVFGPRVLGHGTDIIIDGALRGHISFSKLHGSCSKRSASTPARLSSPSSPPTPWPGWCSG